MLRWTIRVLLVFVVLIVVAAVIVHFVLQSRWLGETILARASEAIGLDVASESLSVGWGGRTTIRDATVTMPLTGEEVLSAGRIEVVHEVIPLLILGRPVNVRSVHVAGPRVNLRRYENGRWNVQDVWTQWHASFDSSDGRNGRPLLPEMEIQDALVHITEPNAAAQTVGPLEFRARRQGRLLWLFDLEMPEVVGARGQIVPGGDWAHEIAFVVGDVEPLVHRLLGGELSPIRIAGRWEGRAMRDGVSGTLRLDRLALGPVTAHGGLLVQAKAGGITVTPQDLVLSEPNLAGREIRLAGGSVRVTNERIEVEQLAAASDLLTARFNGAWDWNARTGEFSGSLAAASQEALPQYNGTFAVSVKSPRFGRKAARVDVSVEAETSFGELNIVTNVEATGADWRQSRWIVSTPALFWSRDGKHVDLAGAEAAIHLAWPEIRLASLRLPGAATTVTEARFDANTRNWQVRLEAHDLAQFKPWGVGSLDFLLDAQGDDRKAQISELRVIQGTGIVVAKGEVSFYERGFQDVQLLVNWPAEELMPALSPKEPTIGRWRLKGNVLGRIDPPGIEITGDLTGRNVVLGKQTVSRIEIPVRAKADPRRIQATTDPFELLGGLWRLSGRHEWATEVTRVDVAADGVSLEAAAGMAGLPLTSQGRAYARGQLAVRGLDPNSAVATGSWSAEDINLPPLKAQEARGRLRISGGLARFDEIVLEQQEGQVRASAEVRLDDSRIVSVELEAKEWPIPLLSHVQPDAPTLSSPAGPGSEKQDVRGTMYDASRLMLHVDGQAKLQLDTVKRTTEGVARVSARVLLDQQDLARIRMSALVQQQTVNLQDLYAETLGGSVEGKARIPLDRWKASSATLKWQGIQPKLLRPWAPQFERFAGVVSGSLEVEQVDSAARPPEPMRFVLNADFEDGWFGPAQVDLCRITGFFGDTRLLIDQANLHVLSGQLNARARVTTHVDRERRTGLAPAIPASAETENRETAGQAAPYISPSSSTYYGTVVVDFNGLDLNQFVHVFDPTGGEFPGSLSGTTTLMASSELNSFGGQARITLSKSDLADVGLIRVLYNTLNLRFGKQTPTGTGEVTVRLEGPSVAIPSFTYFDRGVEIRGAGQIKNINLGGQSPVDGFAVGSTRLLKGVRLPGVRALDRLMATFEGGAASARIGGTLDAVEVNVVPLPEVLGSFRNLLWAQLRE